MERDQILERISAARMQHQRIDLRHEDLSRLNLSGLDLSGADLVEADLSRADLIEANLSGANLRGANLRRTDLIEANLIGANLVETNLSGAELSRADLRGANLRGASLERAYLGGSDLRGASLIDANLIEASLIETNLRRADLSGADLRGAKLMGSDLSAVSLERASLGESDLRGTNLMGSDLRGASLERASLGGSDLRGANLMGSDLRGANLIGAALEQALYLSDAIWDSNTVWPTGFTPLTHDLTNDTDVTTTILTFAPYQQNLHSPDPLLTPRFLRTEVVPLLEAIVTVQQIVDDFQDRPTREIAVRAITQNSPITIDITGGLKEAVELILNVVVPSRRQHVNALAAIELEKARLEVREKELALERAELEIKQLSEPLDEIEYRMHLADLARKEEATRESKLKNDRTEVELRLDTIRKGLDIVDRIRPDLPDDKRLEATQRLLPAVTTILTNDLEIGNLSLPPEQ